MYILDRFEGSFAVIEADGRNIAVPRELVSREAEEGDVLLHSGRRYKPDREATLLRAEAMRKNKKADE